MRTIDLGDSGFPSAGMVAADLLFEEGTLGVRRIRLAAGARIPPCRMQEDVVFVVLGGRVTFRSADREAQVSAPGAVFIPGGAVTRSMESHEDSLVLAVLGRKGRATGDNE